MRPVRTILIESNPLLREGLRCILQKSRFRLLHAAPKVDDLSRFRRDSRALLCVIGARDECGTADQVYKIKGQIGTGQVAVLGGRCEFGAVLAALQAGAKGYLLNTISCEVLLKSLELIALNETVISSEFLSSFDRATLPPWMGDSGCGPSAVLTEGAQLGTNTGSVVSHEIARSSELGTPPRASELNGTRARNDFSCREFAILRCLVNGASNKMIARELDIAEATVKVHVKAILRKIRVNNRTQAAIWAVNNSM